MRLLQSQLPDLLQSASHFLLQTSSLQVPCIYAFNSQYVIPLASLPSSSSHYRERKIKKRTLYQSIGQLQQSNLAPRDIVHGLTCPSSSLSHQLVVLKGAAIGRAKVITNILPNTISCVPASAKHITEKIPNAIPSSCPGKIPSFSTWGYNIENVTITSAR